MLHFTSQQLLKQVFHRNGKREKTGTTVANRYILSSLTRRATVPLSLNQLPGPNTI